VGSKQTKRLGHEGRPVAGLALLIKSLTTALMEKLEQMQNCCQLKFRNMVMGTISEIDLIKMLAM
jgi:hypothetical protein